MITKLNFKSFYKEYIPRFNREYRNCIKATLPVTLYDPIHYVLDNPGKQIRPAFLAAIASVQGNSSFDDIFPAACCVEMIHNFTLVHDDIMDGDLLRHGKETVHTKWSKNEAILSGDELFAIALKQLDHYTIKPDLYARIVPIVLEAVIVVCEGQAQDMEFESRDDVTLTEYLEMVEKKTAWLLAVSARIGAVIGGAEKNEEILIEKIIRELGIVFQIQDDLLELISNAENMGKSLGSDLVKQKKTFPYLYAKQEFNKLEWEKFQNSITEDFIDIHGVEPARKIMEDNFIFDKISEVITLRHVTIQDLINELPIRSRDMFNSIIEFIMNRKK
ncbi:MAG: polyprenyl synthetase family protein [Candidatus Marinimicrobia bacterium]|nr:polyprenyl synthetase family protein [Candidatus Neomarinimicrobiota bacterium]